MRASALATFKGASDGGDSDGGPGADERPLGGDNLKERLNRHFDENKAQIIKFITDLTCRLVKAKTVNCPPSQLHEHPYMDVPGQEGRVAAIFAEEAQKSKLEVKTFEKEPQRPNVCAYVGKGRKKLMVPCHMDVSPPGKGWKTNPFEPVVKGGYIVGRGALDNKGPLVAGLVAAQALKPFERQLKGQLLVLGFSDNEITPTNGKTDCGIDYLLADGLVKPDFAIVPDMGRDMRAISVAEKGRLIVRVRALGKQGHGAIPEKGDNAIMKMSRFLHRVSNMTLAYKPHELMGRPTLNVGEIHGGTCASMVPGDCEVTIDVRYLPGLKSESILGELKKLAAEAGGPFEFSVDSDLKPQEVDPDNILVRSIQENTSQLLGFEAQPVGTGIATIARELTKGGALAVGFGPGNDAVYNSSNEYVEVEQLYYFARIIAGVVIDLFT
jgi:succinyl-diaminopimelate desuccinylase